MTFILFRCRSSDEMARAHVRPKSTAGFVSAGNSDSTEGAIHYCLQFRQADRFHPLRTDLFDEKIEKDIEQSAR